MELYSRKFSLAVLTEEYRIVKEANNYQEAVRIGGMISQELFELRYMVGTIK